MSKIIRVFARKTSYTPEDDYCFYDVPPFPELIPPHDEVHISCTFTWDKPWARELAYQWEAATDKPVTGLHSIRPLMILCRACI